ncbi:hypothetical protein B0H34DRAFT_706932 [Crassisporium funariophilum]|nr:hypothetical protein B0H34DRAFT_706932 [Crassisporium funariophilum]
MSKSKSSQSPPTTSSSSSSMSLSVSSATPPSSSPGTGMLGLAAPGGGRVKSKSPPARPSNVFSNDGSFLDRIRRSMKEEDDKKKEREALLRKKNFEHRFKTRGKRPSTPVDGPSCSESTPESDQPPRKKTKPSAQEEDTSPQAQYQKDLASYTTSLKGTGTGVRPLIK